MSRHLIKLLPAAALCAALLTAALPAGTALPAYAAEQTEDETDSAAAEPADGADAAAEPAAVTETDEDSSSDVSPAEGEGDFSEDTVAKGETAGDVTLSFLDVRGQEHTLVLDETAAMHGYDPEAFLLDGQIMTYADGEAFTARFGIDVSYYQGEIDWEAVADAGCEFVFLRAGYRGYGRGSLVKDRRFDEYLSGAQAAGLDVGVYFFSQAVSEEEAIEEAAFVLQLLSGAELSLPIVCDPEFILDSEGNKLAKARTSGLTSEQSTANVLAFCAAVREAGYETALYSNLLSESEVFDMTAISQAQIPVWYADYYEQPQTPYAFTFWQYSETGSVPGIAGNVDLDIQLIPVEDAASSEAASD